MAKVRLTQIANEAGKMPKEAFEKAKEMGLNVKAVSSTLTEEEAASLYEYLLTGVNKYVPAPAKVAKKQKNQPKHQKHKRKKKSNLKLQKKRAKQPKKSPKKLPNKPQNKRLKGLKS